jgi:hypothetical protein
VRVRDGKHASFNKVYVQSLNAHKWNPNLHVLMIILHKGIQYFHVVENIHLHKTLSKGEMTSCCYVLITGVYDSLNNRFILSVFLKWGPANTVNSYIYVAISATADPTGLWRTYLFDGYS